MSFESAVPSETAVPPAPQSILRQARSVYGVPLPAAWLITLFPWVGAFTLGLMLWFPATHQRGVMLLAEDRLVENLSAVADFLGAILGAAFTLQLVQRGAARRPALGAAFLALMSFGIGGEEISWGQRLFHVRLWHFMHGNVQGENTVHNLPLFHDLSEWLPLGLGVIGLIAILGQTRPQRDRRGLPGLLLSYCWVIVVLGAYDNFTDWVPIDLRIDTIVGQLNEYVEMLVAFCFAIGFALALQRLARSDRKV